MENKIKYSNVIGCDKINPGRIGDVGDVADADCRCSFHSIFMKNHSSYEKKTLLFTYNQLIMKKVQHKFGLNNRFTAYKQSADHVFLSAFFFGKRLMRLHDLRTLDLLLLYLLIITNEYKNFTITNAFIVLKKNNRVRNFGEIKASFLKLQSRCYCTRDSDNFTTANWRLTDEGDEFLKEIEDQFRGMKIVKNKYGLPGLSPGSLL